MRSFQLSPVNAARAGGTQTLVHPHGFDLSKSRRQLSWAAALICLAICTIWFITNLTGSAHGQQQHSAVPLAPHDAVTPSPIPTCSAAWDVVDSQNPCCGGSNAFAAVAAVSANDIWAVGSAYPFALVEHWDGAAWSIVSTPMSGMSSYLQAVSAASSNDVWAVGGQADDEETLIMHWDGVGWSVSTSGTMPGDLHGVAAISTNDAWAVGDFFYDGTNRHPLALHWAGTAWSVVPMPTPRGADSLLNAVSAVSSNDVWAVGCCDDTQGVTAHWDGTAWTLVPNIDGSNAILAAVTAISRNDVWAAGDSWTTFQDYIIHWDGGQWTQVPSLGIAGGNITGMSAIGPDDIWSVGFSYNNSGIFSAHWDGAQWGQVPVQWGVDLEGVAAVSSQNVWAVGESFIYPTGYYPLAEHYGSTCSTSTPTLAATSTAQTVGTSTATQTRTAEASATTTLSAPSNTTTPGPPQSTLTVPPPSRTVPAPSRTEGARETVTSTPTTGATATACSITFTDVPPGSTFYAFIRCMACLGIISGYSDGTFHPSNRVTRGQLAKIVSNSSGFFENHAEQDFEDVLPSNTFYQFIERIYSRGVISGYPCGGPGEPCDAQGRPYFRPNANATRGEITKIDVLCAVQSLGWTLLSPPTNTFEDVGASTTFFQYVETAYAHGVIAGYACGSSPAGVCVPPLNRAYFVPDNNASRGQTSKVAANTFFPDCQPLVGLARVDR